MRLNGILHVSSQYLDDALVDRYSRKERLAWRPLQKELKESVDA